MRLLSLIALALLSSIHSTFAATRVEDCEEHLAIFALSLSEQEKGSGAHVELQDQLHAKIQEFHRVLEASGVAITLDELTQQIFAQARFLGEQKKSQRSSASLEQLEIEQSEENFFFSLPYKLAGHFTFNSGVVADFDEFHPDQLQLNWDDSLLYSGMDNKGNLHVWDTRTRQKIDFGRIHKNPSWERKVTFLGKNSQLVMVGFDLGRHSGVIYDPNDSGAVVAFPKPGTRLPNKGQRTNVYQSSETMVAASPDGEFFLTGTAWGAERLVLWNKYGDFVRIYMPEAPIIQSGFGTGVANVSVDTFGMKSVAFSPNGKWVVATHADLRNSSNESVFSWSPVHIWDRESGKYLHGLEAHDPTFKWSRRQGLSDAVFSPDGSRIYLASMSGLVHSWNALNGNYLGALEMPGSVDEIPKFHHHTLATGPSFLVVSARGQELVAWRSEQHLVHVHKSTEAAINIASAIRESVPAEFIQVVVSKDGKRMYVSTQYSIFEFNLDHLSR